MDLCQGTALAHCILFETVKGSQPPNVRHGSCECCEACNSYPRLPVKEEVAYLGICWRTGAPGGEGRPLLLDALLGAPCRMAPRLCCTCKHCPSLRARY